MIAWFLAVALAGPCDGVATLPDRVSVSWVSPLRERVGGRRFVRVVPTSALMQAVREDQTVGGLVRASGLRRRDGQPKRAYKVVVFDVAREVLCRPVEGLEPGEVVGGVAVCDANAHATRKIESCGVVVGSGIATYRGRWAELASAGFCVLPAARFVAETNTSRAP
jgi:hypothetical protein